MMDTEGGFVHFFRSHEEHKPYQTLSLVSAEIEPTEDFLFNSETGEMRKCFVIQFKQRDGKDKGTPMQVIADDPSLFDLMQVAFEVASKRTKQTDDEQNGSIAVIEQIGQKPKGAQVIPYGLSKVVNGINSAP